MCTAELLYCGEEGRGSSSQQLMLGDTGCLRVTLEKLAPQASVSCEGVEAVGARCARGEGRHLDRLPGSCSQPGCGLALPIGRLMGELGPRLG